MNSINQETSGNTSKNEIGEKDLLSIRRRLSVAQRGFGVTYGPTKMQMECLDIAKNMFQRLKLKVDSFIYNVSDLEGKLIKAGVPPILD